MRLTFSGSQCVGKTTLINDLFQLDEIKDRFSLQNETTRNIWHGVFGMEQLPINEAGTSSTQELICAQHLLNYTKGSFKDTIYDRSALDGLVYTTYLFNKGQVARNVLRIAESLFENLEYDLMMYIPPEVELVDDGERSINPQFRTDVCNIFTEYIESYNIQIGILTGSRGERVDKVLQSIKAYDDYQTDQLKDSIKAAQQLTDTLNNLIKG